ncbi:MAG TPA: hypothetical protein VK623_04685 [Flavobacterium sp.]|nr:hypothetical protein [Flavobacterium sp.]
MGTVNNGNQGKQNLGGQQRHDGQKNYQHSNQRNPDNVRNDTGKHKYAEHDKETNDENFNADFPADLSTDMDFRDKNDNLEDSGK